MYTEFHYKVIGREITTCRYSKVTDETQTHNYTHVTNIKDYIYNKYKKITHKI